MYLDIVSLLSVITNGMPELVLMKIMAHSDFNTTHKYYINISKKVKQREMQEVFNDVFYARAS